MDIASILGFIIGISAVVGGQVLEGGHVSQIMQGTAALIVLGGTAGAMLVSFPVQDIKKAFQLLPLIFTKVDMDVRPTIDEIIRIATIARKEGVLAVEGQRESIVNPLFKKTIKYVIDGFEPNTVKEIIDTEIYLVFEEEEAAGKVWEGTGGYSPTIGIIGAVLGLIHVMSMLNDPSKIGEGIAVAFVATVYGVGIANLWLIPMGTKIKRKAAQRMLTKEVVKLGVVGIQEGLNPHFLQEKLEVFVEEHLRRSDDGGKKE
ncbi:MAG TPA: flagellar motor protein [Bdellovibrionales bacterium]|nr:MAG: flagellar motor protein MotA [Bdellovibrionales bacterium GWB1_52_6]OFZ02644.1 MAG: flagellar motor protein MotA [Bdellovibrionales bacterium GWA1_52_35]OFZ38145.1 MAG: flagellar motor protein MotA [Bdellovibrionales bacterium GWC1_52_8]HAR43241.1 flagellar motor protein [Bdellovibrionales bacterium]HCM41509.1 flagellar motor protein [Bdellovibrionales bacterium]